MKLFEKLGVEERRLNLDARISRYAKTLHDTPRPGRQGSAHFMFNARDPNGIALAAYLNDDRTLCRKYAKETVKNVIELFYGDWRYDPADKEDPMARMIESWIDDYRQGIFWASVLSDWPAVHRLSEYPGEDCVDNSDRKSESSWYLLLASCLRQTTMNGSSVSTKATARLADAELPDPEPPPPNGIWWAGVRLKPATFEELIEHGSRKRIKLLAICLQAIHKKRQADLDKALSDYLKYYRKNEFPRSEAINEKLSLDGTILYHVAVCAGLSPSVPADLADYIVIL